MRLAETLVIYALIGVASGIYLARTRAAQGFSFVALVLLSVVCWPLLLPLLSNPRTTTQALQLPQDGPYTSQIQLATDRILAAIDQAGTIAQPLLSNERNLINAVTQHLYHLNTRIAELQQTLTLPEFDQEQTSQALTQLQQGGASHAAQESTKIQLNNIIQLQDLLRQTRQQIEDSLALLGQIHSQITMLRFTNQSSCEADDKLSQLIHLLDGLQEGLREASS